MFIGQNKNKAGVWFGLFCIFFSGALHAKVPDFSGSWSYYEDRCSYEFSANFDFVQRGNRVTGIYSVGTTMAGGGVMGKLRGVIKGNKLFIRICSNKYIEPSLNSPTCPKYGKRYDAYFVRKGKDILIKYNSVLYGKKWKFEKNWYSFYRSDNGSNPSVIKRECS